jgi:hypothetical protein
MREASNRLRDALEAVASDAPTSGEFDAALDTQDREKIEQLLARHNELQAEFERAEADWREASDPFRLVIDHFPDSPPANS